MSGEPGTHPQNPIIGPDGGEGCVSVLRDGRWYAEKPRVDMPDYRGVVQHPEPIKYPVESEAMEGSEPGLAKPILVSFIGNTLALAAYWLVTQ